MSQSALGIQFSAFLNVYGKFTVLSIVTDLGIRDYVLTISVSFYTSKCLLPVPLECAFPDKDCLFNYVKLSLSFAFFVPTELVCLVLCAEFHFQHVQEKR